MGFLSSLFNTAKWNNDPYQKRLASLILDAAIHRASRYTQGQELNVEDVIALAEEAGWRDKEAADRFVHAVSMIRPIADAHTYQAAKDIAMSLYSAWSR